MVNVIATPVQHHVFNVFDRQGLLLDLPRLQGERNPAYKQRLMDVMVHRASSTYQGLINGITRELGLSLSKTLRVQPLLDSEGNTLLTEPAIEFEHTKCYIYSDYQNETKLLTLDRFSPEGGAYTVSELVDRINGTGYFSASLISGVSFDQRSMTIFNQSTFNIVPSEELSGAGSVIVLENQNLIPGTVSVRSDNLTRMVSSEAALQRPGDYYIKHQAGVIIALGAPAPGSFVRYTYKNNDMIFMSSPVILHNIQSSDFKTKMFQQVTGDDGTEYNGLPNAYGANIINELMSVYPANWGA